MNPDRLAELEEERRYLLQSLRDLDRERAAGDVDERDYQTLRDDYTVRAARVLRDIDEGRAAMPPPPKRHWGKTIAAAVMVVAVGVGIGVAVAQSSGQRLPGDEITGRPGSGREGISERLAEARQLMSTDPERAAELYGSVLEEDPEHVEALTYAGWLSALIVSDTANEELRVETFEDAKGLMDQAIEIDPTYADPYCLQAVIAANFEDDADAAGGPVEKCLELNPPAEMRGLIENFVTDLPE